MGQQHSRLASAQGRSGSRTTDPRPSRNPRHIRKSPWSSMNELVDVTAGGCPLPLRFLRHYSTPKAKRQQRSPGRMKRRRSDVIMSIATTSPLASSTLWRRFSQRPNGSRAWNSSARWPVSTYGPPLRHHLCCSSMAGISPVSSNGTNTLGPCHGWPDIARIERAWLDAYHAADMETLRPEALASIPPERLSDVIFVPHPATRIVCSEFPAVSIFVPNRCEGPVDPIVAVGPQDALNNRLALAVVVRHLPPGGAIFLACLLSGQTLCQAVSAAFGARTTFDLPPP